MAALTASLHDRRASIEGILTVEGLMSTGYQGQPVLHPAARLLNDVEKAMSALEEKLGLSPASRLKLGIMAKESQASDDGSRPSLTAFIAQMDD